MNNINQREILIHSAREKLPKLFKVTQESFEGPYRFKPQGLWYAPGKAWLNFCKTDMPDNVLKEYKYFYVVVPYYTTLDKPNKNKVLKISNAETLDQFTFKYGVMIKDSDFVYIDWEKISELFGGIEVIPLIKERTNFIFYQNDKLTKKYHQNGLNVNNLSMLWYELFDVPSGCIWNPKAIKKLYLLKKNKKYCQFVKSENNNKLDLKRII